MRIKLFTLIFTIISVMISCADILLEESTTNQSISDIEGFWFACEFGSADIDCRFFDDDGLQFSSDGNVYDIETFMIDSDPGCGPSPCFDSFRPTILINRQLVGNYIYNDSSLTFNFGTDTVCIENLLWNSDISFFRDSLSLCSTFSQSFLYFKKYKGEVVIN